MQEKCLDCGADITLGYDFCLSCGSKFVDQMGRSLKEQRIIDKKINKKQKQQKKEFKKRMWEGKKEEIKEGFLRIAKIFLVFLGISIVTGIIGFFVGLNTFDEPSWGFVIGFFAPLGILLILFWIADF